MKKFVISTESFNFNVGGLKVLHKLCHTINSLGREAYLAPSINSGRQSLPNGHNFYIYSRYKTPIIDISQLDPEEYIAIYPESWYGNHTNAKYVIRWMIGPPDINCIKTWLDTDIWFWYIDLYKTSKYNPYNFTKNIDNNLYIGEFHRDIFYNKNYERNQTCWALRKSQPPKKLIHPDNSIFIPYHEHNTAEIFNRSSLFYCYDPYTFLSIQALMCGCESVVLPNDNLSKQDFFNGSQLNKYIAYGIDDIDRSRSIRSNFFDTIDNIEFTMIKDTKIFIEKCDDYFK